MHTTLRLVTRPRSTIRILQRRASTALEPQLQDDTDRVHRGSRRRSQNAAGDAGSAHEAPRARASVPKPPPNAALFDHATSLPVKIAINVEAPVTQRASREPPINGDVLPVMRRASALAFRDVTKVYFKEMNRSKFRSLLDDCMATNLVSAPLRRYLREFPLLTTPWTKQELVLVVGALMKSNRHAIALEVLQAQMKDTGDLNRLNRVAAESARLGNSIVALGVLEIAHHFKIQPDVITYTSAIHACARGGRDAIPQAFDLLDEMLNDGVKPNERTYGALVLAHARLDQWGDIHELLQNIPYDDDGDDGGELTKTAVLLSAMKSCARNRQFVAATKMFMVLVDEGVDLDEKATNAALAACVRTSDTAQLAEIVALIEQHGAPSIYTYNTMLSAYNQTRQIDKALAVLDRMKQGGVEPDVVTFNVLLLGAHRSQRPDLLPIILQDMATRKISWDVYTLNGVLQVCGAHGDSTAATAYWQQAHADQQLRYDRTNYETLLSVYYECGAYQQAIDLWRKDRACRRRARSAKTLNCLLRCCAQLGDVASATSFLEEFTNRGQAPTAIAQNHILAAYLKADDWEGAQHQLKLMASDPAFATTFAFTAMMKHAFEKQQFAQVVGLFEQFDETWEKYSNLWSPQLQYPQDALYVLAARAAHAMGDHETLVRIYQSLPAPATAIAVIVEVAWLVMASCEQKEDWRCAVALYEKLSKHVDDETNVALYDLVVKIVARAGAFERALDVNGGEWYRDTRPDQGWF